MRVSQILDMVYNGAMLNGEPTFELNDTILERIIFAMEDQTKSRVIDLRTGELLPKPEGDLTVNLAPPPTWTPADGFRLMENYCTHLKSVELKRALLKALSHGKGVFKAFRQVLSAYPQEDLQFREYKNAFLRRHIESWMDDMRESMGLSRLGPEPEEYEELLDEEFTVECRILKDLPFELAPLVEAASTDALEWLPTAATLLEKAEVTDFLDTHQVDTFVHFIPEAGGRPIAAAAGAISQVEGRSIGIVRFLYVAKDFRDLGLEFRLLDTISARNHEKGVEHTLFRSIFLRPELASLMSARGLKILGTQFLLD
jgi:GNAT superfamily N-acetyltransferase